MKRLGRANDLQTPRGVTDRSVRGTVLVAVIIALVILQLLVVGVVLSGARDHDMTARRAESARAFYASESAMQLAMRELVRNEDVDGDGAPGSIAARPLVGGAGTVTRENAGSDITLTAAGVAGLGRRSASATIRQAAAGAGGSAPGVAVEVWLLTSSPRSLAAVPWTATPSYVGVIPNINFPGQSNATPRFAGMPQSRIGMRCRARLNVPTSGLWTFYTNSDDGSDLWIDGVRVVNNDGLHSMTTRSGTVTLEAGEHDLEVRFFENTGSNGLVVSWRGPGDAAASVIPPSALSTTLSMSPLVAHTTMYLYGDSSNQSTLIDAYNSLAGAYGGANVLTTGAVAVLNSTANQAWRMNGRATLQGSAIIGPGGVVSSVVDLADAASITGSVTSATSRTAIFVIPPAIAPSSSGAVTLTGSSTLTRSTDVRWSSISLKDDSVLTLSGTIRVRVDGDIRLEDRSSLVLGPGADVTMFVAGAIEVRNHAAMNPSTAAAGRLRVYMSGLRKDVLVESHARISAHILNPRGSLRIIPLQDALHSFSGRFAGDTVEVVDQTDIHLDLFDGGVSGSGGSGELSTIVRSWSAVQP